MQDILVYLMKAAVTITGYAMPAELPEVVPVSQQTMMHVVCQRADDPASCKKRRGLVAAYVPATHTVFYRYDLDLQNDTANSFVVHEFVHVLQHNTKGDRAFYGCANTVYAENEAYTAQRQYLFEHNQVMRIAMPLYRCAT